MVQVTKVEHITKDELKEQFRRAKKLSLVVIGTEAERDIKKRFDLQGPGWAPLKPATIAAKQSDEILIDTGLLQNSIEFKVKPEGLEVGVFNPARTQIALAHEFGFPPHNLPARPFIRPGFQEASLHADEISMVFFEAAVKGQLKRDVV